MKKKLMNCALAILTCLTIAACRKGEIMPKSPPATAPTTGLYILNNGQDPSSLSFYNLATNQLTPDRYSAVNGKLLGNNGNDVEIYGSKMYITVTNSGVVDILNAKTGRLIKQDSILNSAYTAPWYSYNKEPRDMVCYKGNVYISCYDGTIAVMDTVNFSVSTKITLPGVFYLEGMVVQNNKLYVADAGVGPGVNNLVSVIDLSTNKEVKRVSVVPYPVSLAADGYGSVYVLSGWTDDWQQFYISTGGFSIIDSNLDSVKYTTTTGSYPALNNIPIVVNGDLVYHSTGANKIGVYNAKTQTEVSDNFITDGTNIKYPFAICANPLTGEIYIADGKDGFSIGTIDIFDKTGKLEYSFPSGIGPVKIRLLK